jgi:hypothetical protein
MIIGPREFFPPAIPGKNGRRRRKNTGFPEARAGLGCTLPRRADRRDHGKTVKNGLFLRFFDAAAAWCSSPDTGREAANRAQPRL